MGEVYRARDTRLDRLVAIKVLPEVLAADPEFRDRFAREARAISSLSHPHICPLFDVGLHEGINFLVMECLDGEPLSDRIAKGPLTIDEALTIAIEIGSALDAAHRAGIIHRDFKPGNVMLTKSGAKLLDFGLAKTGTAQAGWAGGAGRAGSIDLSAPPTMTTPLSVTAQGTILGTFQYMAPEQLEGADADARTDIFAFGCVLYEMLSGKKAFHGKTQVSLIGAILRDTPPPIASPTSAVPASLNWLIGKCLAKDPDRRWQTAADLVSQLEFIAEEDADAPARVAAKPVAQTSMRRRTLLVAATVVVAAVTGAAAWWLKPSPPEPGPVRFTITPPADAPLAVGSPYRDVAVSPDGKHVVYHVGTSAQSSQLIVRAIDQLDAAPLRGLASPGDQFISPDGGWIGFAAAGNELKKISITGGPSIMLCRFRAGFAGGSWGPDDTIVFATSERETGLLSVAAGGGEPKVLTKPDARKGEFDHLFPFVLPNGRAVLFTVIPAGGRPANENTQVAVLDLKTGQQKTLIRGGGQAQYADSGHIVYAAGGSLRAVRFDPVSLEVLGDPVPVVEQVATKTNGAVQFSVSRTGTLVYVAGGAAVGSGPARTLVWVDRQGREEPIKAPPRAYTYPRLSPDGTKAAFEMRDQDNDIWIWDFAHATLTRLTFDPGAETYPVWTPDGKRVLFGSGRAGALSNIFAQQADGTGIVEQLTNSNNGLQPSSVSPDGTRVVVREATSGAGNDLALLQLGSASGTIEPLVHTQFGEQNGEISPDGRWLAYQSNESGNNEVYVRPFPNVNGGRWQVSSGGGTKPLWARGGRELFFVAGNNRGLMSVPVQLTPGFSNGNPSTVFEGPYLWTATGMAGRTYDVSKDGQKFLVIKEVATDDKTSTPAPSVNITVVLNWFEELKAKLPSESRR